MTKYVYSSKNKNDIYEFIDYYLAACRVSQIKHLAKPAVLVDVENISHYTALDVLYAIKDWLVYGDERTVRLSFQIPFVI